MDELKLFLESCRSEETKQHYSFCLKKYFNFVGELSFNNRKAIEDKIIEFIISLKKEGKSGGCNSELCCACKIILFHQ